MHARRRRSRLAPREDRRMQRIEPRPASNIGRRRSNWGGWGGWAGTCLWLALTSALAAPAAQVQPGGHSATAPSLKPADLAERVLQIVNRQRLGLGLRAWQPDPDLALIAQAHSLLMAQRGQIGHDGFDGRFAQARRPACVENLAAGFEQAEPLVAAWLASPSHRDNLLAPSPRHVGLAHVAGYISLLACE